MSKILVIEDNDDLAFGLRNNLEIEGYEVEIAADGEEGLARARRRPDLVVLDLMLPGTDGFRVLRTLRQQGFSAPILILTARGDEADKVRGLRLGGDDYVTKPFGLLELLARVEALLRRQKREAGGRGAELPDVERFGDVAIDCPSRTVTKAGRPVELAPKEFDLLLALVRRRGAVATRLELMREVWGYDDSVVTRTIDTHVAELRRKLEGDSTRPRHIVTVRKVGYRLKS